MTLTVTKKVAIEKAKKDAKKAYTEKYLACMFILVEDTSRFQGLKCALDNQYLMDKDAYPTSMPQVLKLLEKNKADSGAVEKPKYYDNDSGVVFAQTESWDAHVTCHKCSKKGHRVNDCPDLTYA